MKNLKLLFKRKAYTQLLCKKKTYDSDGKPNNLIVPASRSLTCLSLSSQANARIYFLGCHATVNVGDSQGTSVIFSPKLNKENY